MIMVTRWAKWVKRSQYVLTSSNTIIKSLGGVRSVVTTANTVACLKLAKGVDLKTFSSQEKRIFNHVWRWVLTRRVVIILQYT